MSVAPVLDRRRSGILLHPSSLPGRGQLGGRLGPKATHFCDFLQAAGFSIWQTLPLTPRDAAGSPYRSPSAFAIDPGLLDPAEAADPNAAPAGYTDFLNAQRYWLDDYALYTALRSAYAMPWYEWPTALRRRNPEALAAARQHHAEAIESVCRTQFLCHRAWVDSTPNCNRATLFQDFMRRQIIETLSWPMVEQSHDFVYVRLLDLA